MSAVKSQQSHQAKVRKIGDRITFINLTPYPTPIQSCHKAMTIIQCFRKEAGHWHIFGNPSSRKTEAKKEKEEMKGNKKPEEKEEMK